MVQDDLLHSRRMRGPSRIHKRVRMVMVIASPDRSCSLPPRLPTWPAEEVDIRASFTQGSQSNVL